MVTTIAIANQKGGVGKTTTACTLAHHFAICGRRVLVVDLDAQGHVARLFKLKEANGLYRLVVAKERLEEVVVKARNNLDAVLNDHTDAVVDLYFKNATMGRENLLLEPLQEAQGKYDVVFLDVPPAVSSAHLLALVASDYMICPATMDVLGLDGVNKTLKTILAIQSTSIMQPPKFMGVVPVMFDRTTSETFDKLDMLQKELGHDFVLPPIPRDTHIREATACGQTIWEYAPRSSAAAGYAEFSMEVNSLGRFGGYLHLAELIEKVIF
jgi:chromosome partitioning protein